MCESGLKPHNFNFRKLVWNYVLINILNTFEQPKSNCYDIALIDILRSNFEGNNKLIWVIVVVFSNVLGFILYFLMGKNQKLNE